jgi:asparagine synthase (glutamine-hydrolysing)
MRTRATPDAVLSAERWMPAQAAQWHPQHRAQYLESRLLMDTYLLSSQGDRMLMANGVEGRFPFLDPDLIRFANALAPRSKMPGLNEKALLKRAVQDLLPATILSRPKQPYRAPGVEHLLRGDYAEQLLSETALKRAGYFDPSRVALLQRKALAGKLPAARDQMALTAVVSTQLWHQQFIEGKALAIGAAA